MKESATEHGRILQGDCLAILKTLPSKSVHCCITSPPYWNLRDYLTSTWEGGREDCDHLEKEGPVFPTNSSEKVSKWRKDFGKKAIQDPARRNHQYKDNCKKCGARKVDYQLGSEPTPEEYIAKMVEVFREVRRVLRDDGVLWLNLGDTYAGGGRGGNPDDSPFRKQATNKGSLISPSKIPKELKAGNLIGIPWRVALALQADGWILRQDIIWWKPNSMPESVASRCSKSHEYVFLLTKTPSYFSDFEAIKEKSKGGVPHNKTNKTNKYTTAYETGDEKHRTKVGLLDYANRVANNPPQFVNKRSVWSIPIAPFKGNHFAVFPVELPRLCILAGSSVKGCCVKCGSPWKRKSEKKRVATRPGKDGKVGKLRKYVIAVGGVGDTSILTGNRDPLRHVTETKTVGWEPTCNCNAGDPVPCTILDPFSGSGTSGYVAIKHGRKYIGIELNPEYVKLSIKRLRKGELKKDFTGLVFPA